MSKQTENYIGSQQHWEDRINDDYDYLKQMEKKMEKDVEKLIYNRLEKRNKMILIPKEEAKELFGTFYQTTYNMSYVHEPLGEFAETIEAWNQAKQCALIAVDKILLILDFKMEKSIGYYLEVKEEIEKL